MDPKPHRIPMTDGTPVACHQKNAEEFLKGRVPGTMAQYGLGLFGPAQQSDSCHPAPDDPEGVRELVDWRQEAPYG